MFDKDIDLTCITNCMSGDGIGRQGIGLINTLHDTFKINSLLLPPTIFKDVPPEVLKIFQTPFKTFGKVSFWTYILGVNESIVETHKAITSPLKMAYSMIESTKVPKLWVSILNTYYHMLLVPDPFLIEVYRSSGVSIPIFVLPLGIEIDDLLSRPIKTKANDPFLFYMSGGLYGRKNHLKILQAFGKKFGNNPKFRLRLHGRFGPQKTIIEAAVKEANYSNVELITSPLSPQQYNQFMDECNCYLYNSMGEAWSISPRECAALAKPCIISNNTAHKSLCDAGCGFVPLQSDIEIPAYYELFNQTLGNYFDSNVDDLANLMVEVVDNYPSYLEKAKGGRELVQQWTWQNLKPIYINLFSPKLVSYGKSNLITQDTFQTNDKKLYQRLKTVFS